MWKAVKQVPVRPLILIGAGNLGTSLCSNYNEFEGKGLKIVAAFDHDPIKCGTQLGHIEVVEHVSSIHRIAKEHGAKIAILAIAGEKAQEITKLCVDAGISTILNYSPVSLNVPNYVHVEYMDPALKIQMALSSHATNHSRHSNNRSSSYRMGLTHFSPFPAHIGQPMTPLLMAFRKYAKLILETQRGTIRGFATYNRSMPAMLQSNRYLSDFAERSILGQGGFGSVYQARNLIDGMDYAVKKVRLAINSTELNYITDHKYLREVRAMARLNHINLVRYYYAWMEFDEQSAHNSDVDSSNNSISCTNENTVTCDSYSSNSTSCSRMTSGDTTTQSVSDSTEAQRIKLILYIQMELCTGVTLKDWLGKPGRVVHIPECHAILMQIAHGLQHIHSHGFIHRDVTPANIFLERLPNQIVIKIGDFGLAKHCGDTESRIDAELLQASTGGDDKTIGVGTLLYASPEQLSNAAYDTKADMYSVGVILFELLHPFNTQMERVVALTQLKEGHIAPKISVYYPKECSVVEKLLNRNPSQRPSAEEILAYVQQIKL